VLGAAAAAVCVALAAGSFGNGDVPGESTLSTAAKTLSLTQRVLAAGQFAGMKPRNAPIVTRGASEWAVIEGLSYGPLALEVGRLRKLGFVAGVDENLVTPGNGGRYGVSIVEQFSSTAAAQSELAHAASANGPWSYFAVPGIPGARGFESVGGVGGGRNIAFADGPFFYLEGSGWTGSSREAVSRSVVTAAARLIYQRILG
jgi:hypothetical protein